MNQPQMGAPVNPWMMETGSIIFWSILVVVTLLLTWKNGKLPLVGLCLIAATSSFWQEFFGDWGAYVAWNPAFARLPFWGEMAYTTPVKPLFIPYSWGWWFAVSLPLLVTLVSWLGRKLPAIFTNWLALLIAFNTASINADARVREHATMFAFGLPVRAVLAQDVTESCLIGLLGTATGLLTGWLLLDWLITDLLPSTLPDLRLLVPVSGTTLVLALLMGVVAVSLAPVLTLRRLLRMDIPSALRVVE